MRSLLSFSLLCVLSVLGVFARDVSALSRIELAPHALKEVDLKEKLGAKIPLATTFVDSQGKEVHLADVIGGRPVILTFNYSNCPMLCSVQLKGLVDALTQMEWTLGKEYRVITISLDPSETQERATATRNRYLGDYARAHPSSGWTFLTGTKENIDAIADAVGFGYTFDKEKNQYFHAAVLTILSPSGSVSTYIYGVSYDATNLRDKLLIAGLGETSEAVARFILSCFHYDAPKGNGAIVSDIMRYGGFVFLLGFAGLIALSKRRRHLEALRSEEIYPHANQVGSIEDHV